MGTQLRCIGTVAAAARDAAGAPAIIARIATDRRAPVVIAPAPIALGVAPVVITAALVALRIAPLVIALALIALRIAPALVAAVAAA